MVTFFIIMVHLQFFLNGRNDLRASFGIIYWGIKETRVILNVLTIRRYCLIQQLKDFVYPVEKNGDIPQRNVRILFILRHVIVVDHEFATNVSRKTYGVILK